MGLPGWLYGVRPRRRGFSTLHQLIWGFPRDSKTWYVPFLFRRPRMGDGSAIEWTDATWNPVTGCTKISPGCKNCYAQWMARRLHAMGQERYKNNFAVTLQPDVLDQPLRWIQPRKIFVNSMSDLFHPDVSLEFIRSVFDIMGKCYWHTFQILTKR